MRLVLRRISRHHPSMVFDAQPWRLAPTAALFAALVACGPTPTPVGQAQAPPANATVSGLAAPPSAAILPPMPDPDHDPRPDRAKADDFTAHLERLQGNMTAVDADFLGRVRTAMQAGSQTDAARVLADYRALIAADIAALPSAPRLSGCYAKASAPNATAEAAIAAMLSDRRDKADAVAAITDRPLTLADFGGLATDIATSAGAADASASLAAVRASVAGCREAPAATARPAAAPAAQPAAGPPPNPNPPPTAQRPPKKPGFFQRIFGG
jgi:hypothetical protein